MFYAIANMFLFLLEQKLLAKKMNFEQAPNIPIFVKIRFRNCANSRKIGSDAHFRYFLEFSKRITPNIASSLNDYPLKKTFY